MAVPDWLLRSAAPRAAQQAAPTSLQGAEEDPSISASLIPKILGPFEIVGNAFDTFGGASSVRDLIGGALTGQGYSGKYNPVDQFASPFKSQNRVTFRDDILPDMGLMRANRATGLATINPWSDDFDLGEFGRDVIGFGLDVVTDPLSWINPFGAMTKGGQAALRSGLSKREISKVFRAAYPEQAAKGAGWRRASMYVTPQDIRTQTQPRKVNMFEVAEDGTTKKPAKRIRTAPVSVPKSVRTSFEDAMSQLPRKDASEPLRKGMGYGFMSNRGAISNPLLSRRMQERIATGLDKTGEFASGTMRATGLADLAQGAIRGARAALDPAVGGMMGRAGQKLARVKTEELERLMPQTLEELNIARNDMNQAADLIAEQLSAYNKSVSPLPEFADVVLGDVVRATDRPKMPANFGRVEKISKDSLTVRFVSPNGNVAVREFPHASKGTSPAINANLSKAQGTEIGQLGRNEQDVAFNLIDDLVATFNEEKLYRRTSNRTPAKGRSKRAGKPKAGRRDGFEEAVYRTSPELNDVLKNNPVLKNQLRRTVQGAAEKYRQIDKKLFDTLRSMGVPMRNLRDFQIVSKKLKDGQMMNARRNLIDHIARYGREDDLGLGEILGEAGASVGNKAQIGRRDELRYLPKRIINLVSDPRNRATEPGKGGRFLLGKNAKEMMEANNWGNKQLVENLDPNYVKYGEDGFIADPVVDTEGVFGPAGEQVFGKRAHAIDLHKYLTERGDRGKIFQNRFVDDAETYAKSLTKAGANARAVFDALADPDNRRIPQRFDTITVKALQDDNLGKYQITGKVGDKVEDLGKIGDAEQLKNVIGEKNARNVMRSAVKDTDYKHTINTRAPFDESQDLTQRRFQMSGGVPAHEALKASGLFMDEASVTAAVQGLRAQIGSMDIDAELVSAISKRFEPFQKPELLQKFLTYWDKLTQMFKNNVTVPFPAFAVRNLGSGQIMNIAASGEVNGSRDLLKYFRSGWSVRELMQNPGGKQSQELLAQMKAYGVLPDTRAFEDVDLLLDPGSITASGYRVPQSPGWGSYGNIKRAVQGARSDMANKVADDINRLGRTRLRNKPGIRQGLAAHDALIRWGSANNAVVEMYNRATLFHYLTKKKKFSPLAAARKVKEMQFDYSDITGFDREVMKRAVPFYTFTKKMAATFVRTLAGQPGGPMRQAITAQSRALDPNDTRPVPDTVAKGTAIPFGKTETGEDRYISGLGMAWESPMQFIQSQPRDIGYQLASQTHPLIKFPIEYMTDQSMFMGGRDFDDLDPTVGRLMRNVERIFDEDAPKTPRRIGKLNEQVISSLPITRALTTARQMTDERRGNLEKAVNFLTGLKTHVVNERSRDTLLEQKARESLQEAGGRVFSRAYVPERTLAAASEDERRRLLAINQLLQRLAERAKAMSENRPVPQLFDRP